MSLESLVSEFVSGVSINKIDASDAVDWFHDHRGPHGLSMQDYSRFVDAVKARGVDVPLVKIEGASVVFDIPPTLTSKLPSPHLLVEKYRRGVSDLLEALDKKLSNREIAEFLAANEKTLGKPLDEFFEDAPAWYDVEVHWRRKRRKGRNASGQVVEFIESYQSGIGGQPAALVGDDGIIVRRDPDGKILIHLDGEETKAVTLRSEDEGTIWRFI